MIARRASVLLLSIVLSSPAAAQVRAIPVEAGTAPLAIAPAGTQPASFAPSLSATPLAASLGGTPVVSAPSAPAALTPAIAAAAVSNFASAASAAAPLSAAAPAHSPHRAYSGVSSVQAPPALSAPAAQFAARDASAARRSSPRGSAENPPVSIAETLNIPSDRLFDGRAALVELPAAAAGPERVSGKARALDPAPRLLGRAGKILNIAVPVAAVGAVALGTVSPHLALAGLHLLGQASYWIANPLAFMFTVPQIYRILSHRSAEVSTSMTAIGLLSALVTTLCFAFDGKDLMMYRNLAQTAGFAAMLGLEAKYAHAKGRAAPSRKRALIETGAVVLGFGAILALAGPALMAVIPGVALMSSLIVPFQILSGFGFTFMMYAQLKKMNLEHSAGDSSAGMMWAYLGTKVIWVWSFATMLSLVAAPVWLTLTTGAVFAGACWLATRYALSRLTDSTWSFLPEKFVFRGRALTRRTMGDAAAFVALAALVLALSGIGHLAFASLLGITAGSAPLFAMYLIYTVQNLVAAMATSKTLRLQTRFGQEALKLRP